MITGIVKWFNAKLNYGFIVHEDGREVFVHYTVINPGKEGFKTLHDGETVEYEVVDGPQGLIASKVITTPFDHSDRYKQAETALPEAPSCNTN